MTVLGGLVSNTNAPSGGPTGAGSEGNTSSSSSSLSPTSLKQGDEDSLLESTGTTTTSALLAAAVGVNHQQQQQAAPSSLLKCNNNSPLTSTSTAGPAVQCAACRQHIFDRFIMRVHPNLEFHASCLKCAECSRFLDESCTAFVRDGRTYCATDYHRCFGSCARCAQCSVPFERHELVMRARHLAFHPVCFRCNSCQRHLSPGDEFVIRGELLFCRHDCSKSEQPPLFGSSGPTAYLSFESSGAGSGGGGGGACLQPLSTPPLQHSSCGRLESSVTPSSSGGSSEQQQPPKQALQLHRSVVPLTPTAAVGAPPPKKKSKKDKPTTRVRTVLNEQQLQTLKSMYAQCPRPDATTKEVLVEMTGLNARVIRVWFQNKRCKDKKRSVQQKTQEASAEKERALHNVRIGGLGPLVVHSPQPLGPPPVGHLAGTTPIDIESFAQPIWQQQQVDDTTQDNFSSAAAATTTTTTAAAAQQHLLGYGASDSTAASYTIMAPRAGAPPFGAMPPQLPPPLPHHHHHHHHLSSSDLSSPSCASD